MVDEKRQTFAPVPTRAMADEGLTALDQRLLNCLAAHDRFGANGIGCYASHPRLAGLVKCHLKSLSRSLRVLAELGYIKANQHPLNKRLRDYHVVYNSDDKAVMKGGIGSEPVTDKVPIDGQTGNEPVTDKVPIDGQTGSEPVTDKVPIDGQTGNEPVPEDEPIGNQDFQKGEQYQSDAEVNIFSEAGRYPAEAVIDSAEAATPYGDAKDLLGKEEPESDRIPTTGNLLGRIQTWLKSLEGERLTEGQIDELHEKSKFCEQVDDEHGLDGVGPWAQRLTIDIGILLDESGDEDDEPVCPEDRAVSERAFTTTETTGDGEFVGEPRRFATINGGRS